MSAKEKFKSFWEKHGDIVTIVGMGVGLIGSGVLIGIGARGAYDINRANKALKGGNAAAGVLMHAKNHYAKNCDGKILSGIELDPVKVSDMGELGKRIVECRPKAENFKATHFIMIGTDK